MKQIPKTISILSVSMLALMPFFAHANTPLQKNSDNFCATLPSMEQKLLADITHTQETQAKKNATVVQNREKKDAGIDEKKATSRITVDGKRASTLNKMSKKATTDDEKKAVEVYKNDIVEAVKARRTAVDTSIKTYREALASYTSTHSADIHNLLASFKNDITKVLAKAQSDCTTKTKSVAAHKNFTLGIKNARSTFQDAERALIEAPERKDLKNIRDTTIAKADADFKSAVTKAHAQFLMAIRN